jgi:hypothetical protein
MTRFFWTFDSVRSGACVRACGSWIVHKGARVIVCLTRMTTRANPSVFLKCQGVWQATWCIAFLLFTPANNLGIGVRDRALVDWLSSMLGASFGLRAVLCFYISMVSEGWSSVVLKTFAAYNLVPFCLVLKYNLLFGAWEYYVSLLICVAEATFCFYGSLSQFGREGHESASGLVVCSSRRVC